MPVLCMATNALKSSEESWGHISAPPNLLLCEKRVEGGESGVFPAKETGKRLKKTHVWKLSEGIG